MLSFIFGIILRHQSGSLRHFHNLGIFSYHTIRIYLNIWIVIELGP